MRLLLALLALLVAVPAQAQKSADTLRVSSRDAVPDLNPYDNSLRAGLVVAHQTFDGLVYRDPDSFTIKPLLATSWKYVDDTTLEFELRRGVKFHDGSPFSADDVVYTFNSIMSDKRIAVPSNYDWLAGAEKIDDFHVRLKLKHVFPAALEYIAIVSPILPKAYRERVGAEAFGKTPVGAGPYRFARVLDTTEIDLERFDDYYADSPKGKPAIRWVAIREVPDAATELSDILGGRADWIWNFASDDYEAIAKVPTLVAERAESMRIGYLLMDAAGRSGPNPFTNLKVRQAVFYAIDRQAIVKNLMQGLARVPEAPCYPTQFGCDAWAAVRYDYNPAKAKQLLAEAGYPNGFDADVTSYVLPQYSGAVQTYLRAVGINTNVSTMQVAAAVQRVTDGKAEASLGTFGSYSINDVSAILPYFFGGGGNDYSRDPEVEKLIEQGGASINPDERRRNYIAAIHLIADRAYWLPLHTYVTTYAFSRQLNFRPHPDEIPRFYLSSWK